MRSLRSGHIILVLLAVCCVGCGGGPGDMPELGQVSGKVLLNGNPLANATVEFKPDEGRPSVGTTGADGTYTLQYTVDEPGAKVGNHTVKVTMEGDDSEEDYEEDYEESDANKPQGSDDGTPTLPPMATDGSIQKKVVAGDNRFDIALE